MQVRAGLDDLQIVADAPALFRPSEIGGGAVEGAGFQALAELVERERPSLVVVDPVSAAAGAVGLNDAVGARSIMMAFASLSAATRVGFLIIAHDTKSARTEARAGLSPGAGAVSGSGQWHDAARAVLYMHRVDGGREIECLKANHGRDGWAVPLSEVMDKGEVFRGFRAAGDPWWDYESIRRGRRAEAATQVETDKKAAKEAANKRRGADTSAGTPADGDWRKGVA